MRLLALLLLALVTTPRAAIAQVDWIDEEALNRAAEIISEQCSFFVRYECIRAPFEACVDERGSIQPVINACAGVAHTAWQRQVDALLARARFIAPLSYRPALEASQAAWEQLWATTCGMIDLLHQQGSMAPMMRAICRADHAAFRAFELIELIEWWERLLPTPRVAFQDGRGRGPIR